MKKLGYQKWQTVKEVKKVNLQQTLFLKQIKKENTRNLLILLQFLLHYFFQSIHNVSKLLILMVHPA